DARGWPIVFHCHDEITIEAPDGTLTEHDLLTLMLETPAWAAGLPLGGKVHSGSIYFEGPAIAEPPASTEAREVELAGKIKIEDNTCASTRAACSAPASATPASSL